MEDEYYFMKNILWYRYDVDKEMYVLTDRATEEAKKSYEEYLKARSFKSKHYFT